MTEHIQRLFNRTLLFVSIFSSLLTLQASVAFAQGAAGLTIKPAIVEEKANPGQSYEYSLSVTNEGSAQQTFYLQAQDIKGLNDQGLPVFAKEGEATGYELSSWIRFGQSSVTLLPKETKTVSFSVDVPARASPGAHFASVLFTDHPGKLQANGSAVGLNIGAIVSLQIAGNIIEQANLEEFSTGKLIYGSPSVDFHAKVENTGNVLVRPTGLIEVSNMFGQQIASVPVNENTSAVFPNSSRTYTSTWNYGGFLFGRYQAVVSLAYGESERKTISNTTSFWVLPLKSIGIVLGSLLVLVCALWVLMRLYVQKKLRQMGVENTSRSDAALYRRRYQQSNSKLMVVTLGIALLCIVFLVVLFVLFA